MVVLKPVSESEPEFELSPEEEERTLGLADFPTGAIADEFRDGGWVLGLDWDWLEELEEPELESDSESELESELDELDGALGLAGVDVSGGGDGELEGAGERFCWVWVLIGEGVRDGVDLLGDPWGGLLEGDLLGACSDSEFASEPSGVLGGFLRRRSLDGM